MKRDMELIIEILKQVEECNDLRTNIYVQSSHYEDKVVQYNVGLMIDAGLIAAYNHASKDGIRYEIKNMTWAGHDFLDSARSETVVEKAKLLAKSKGLEFASLPLDIAKELLSLSLRSMIGL